MENLKTIRATLTLFIKDNKILLGEKKRGFAKGTLNGIGGKQDPGETVDQAMVRECQEEVGATPLDYKKIGRVNFNLWYKGEHTNMEMHIYKCHKYAGKIQETEEIIPAWYDMDKIPFDKMLSDDILWLPYVLQNKKVIGKVNFDKDMHMLYNNFKPVEYIDETEMSKL